jgi:hypothetical protein
MKKRLESKAEFWSRMDREGCRAEAEAAQAEMLAEGFTKRQVQDLLVQQFQPLDGTRTRAWPTPDSWACGRLDARRPPPAAEEQLELDVQWVHADRDRPPEEAPTTGARLLLETAQANPGEFLKLYLRSVPRIARRQRERLDERRDRVEQRRAAAQAKTRREREEAQRRAEAKKKAAQKAAREAAKARQQPQKELEPTRAGPAEDDWGPV